MYFKITTLLLLLLLQLILASDQAPGYGLWLHSTGLSTDKAALLAFKKTITADPNSTLANWDITVPACNFTGVVCRRSDHRVRHLILPGSGLVGLLSPSLSNLTSLRVLDLADNHLFGTIPSDFSLLRGLNILTLYGNNLQGPLPGSISVLCNLVAVVLEGNNLSGPIPASLFSNCSLLENVDLSNNFLAGQVPPQIGNCPNLWSLTLYNNHISGELPTSLANASSLSNLDVESNLLSGQLPCQTIAALSSIRFLHLSYNQMVSHDGNTNLDPFFISLSNCSHLEELEIAGMNLGGRLPASVGHLGVNATYLLLQENRIFGSIPAALANLSSLEVLNLTSNNLNGPIPAQISKLMRLQQLFLSYNSFGTEIPAALGEFSHLGLLDLSHNNFSGHIPRALGDLGHVDSMFLNNNNLSGTIPSSLGECTDLYRLDLSHNQLTGTIPPEMSGLREIRIFLNLSHNHLRGPVPAELLTAFANVQEIDFSSNNLSGTIFPQLSSCVALRVINLSHNSLGGTLPESLGKLKDLESLDASCNNFSGNITPTLNQIPALKFLNLSFNDLTGVVPSGGIFDTITHLSFLGNPRLCLIRQSVPCRKIEPRLRIRSSRPEFILIVIVVFSIVALVAAFTLTIFCCISKRLMISTVGFVKVPKTSSLVSSTAAAAANAIDSLLPLFPRITYRQLSEATDGFDPRRLIGAGGYGRVYRGDLPDGTVVAIKVLVCKNESTKSFDRECQVLKRIRHRNLIRVITACSLPDFKALVLPHMANGSLNRHLYPPAAEDSGLNLMERVRICSDVAEGMAYLHHHSPIKVIHCDLKPSNVLLNEDMTALVADFGIARLVMTEDAGNISTANGFPGTFGYIAPEYGCGSKPSTKGDVYSFGILVLEMVTRKRPTDDMFVGELSLQKWVKSNHCGGELEQVVDPSLASGSKHSYPLEVMNMREVAIKDLIEMGILCTHDSASARPTMLEIADGLDRLKQYLSGEETTATHASSQAWAMTSNKI